MHSWKEEVASWSSPPVDNSGYWPSAELVQLPETDLKTLVRKMREARYSLEGWRNAGNGWRANLRLDTTTDKDVLDFGCGTGIEALEIAQQGNRVSIADISSENLELAQHIFSIHGESVVATYIASNEAPFLTLPPEAFDVFHCSGVLHHSRHPVEIMERAHAALRSEGEARLLLYSDRGWRVTIGTEPPEKVETDPNFWRFVRTFDEVGFHADWYNRAKLERLFGHLFCVETVTYITPDDRYLVAVLKKRGKV